MKITLDQLLDEFKKKEFASENVATDISVSSSALTQKLSWEERGLLLIKFLEDNSGSISKTDLLKNNMVKLGIQSSENGRLFFKNFISWFIQQGIIKTSKYKNRIYYLLNEQFNTTNIKEYFSLVSERMKSADDISNPAKSFYNKRVILLKNLLKKTGTLLLSSLLNDFRGELGFHKNLQGKKQAVLFLKDAVRNNVIMESERDNQIWISVKPTDSNVISKYKSKPQNKVKQIVKTSQPKLIKTTKGKKSLPTPISIKKEKTLNIFHPAFLLSLPPKVQKELDIYYWKRHYEEQINLMDDHVISLCEQINVLKKQLFNVDRLIVEIYQLRHSDF